MQRHSAVTERVGFARINIADHVSTIRVYGRVAMVGGDARELLQAGAIITGLHIHPALPIDVEVHEHVFAIRVPVGVVTPLVGPFGCRNGKPYILTGAGHGEQHGSTLPVAVRHVAKDQHDALRLSVPLDVEPVEITRPIAADIDLRDGLINNLLVGGNHPALAGPGIGDIHAVIIHDALVNRNRLVGYDHAVAQAGARSPLAVRRDIVDRPIQFLFRSTRRVHLDTKRHPRGRVDVIEKQLLIDRTPLHLCPELCIPAPGLGDDFLLPCDEVDQHDFGCVTGCRRTVFTRQTGQAQVAPRRAEWR